MRGARSAEGRFLPNECMSLGLRDLRGDFLGLDLLLHGGSNLEVIIPEHLHGDDAKPAPLLDRKPPAVYGLPELWGHFHYFASGACAAASSGVNVSPSPTWFWWVPQSWHWRMTQLNRT